MSKSLVSIVSEVNKLEMLLVESAGELTPEIESMLEVKDIQLPEKVDGYSYTLERLEAVEAFYSSRAKAFQQAAKTLASAQASIKDRLKIAMREMQVDELLGNDIKFKLSKSKPRLVIDDESKLAKEYKIEVITTELQKDKILEDLKIGPIDGARLEESFALRMSVNKGVK